MATQSHNAVRWLVWLAALALPFQATPVVAMCVTGPCCCSHGNTLPAETDRAEPLATTAHQCHSHHLQAEPTTCHEGSGHHPTACQCHPNCQCRLASQPAWPMPLSQQRVSEDLGHPSVLAVSAILFDRSANRTPSMPLSLVGTANVAPSDLCITLCRFAL